MGKCKNPVAFNLFSNMFGFISFSIILSRHPNFPASPVCMHIAYAYDLLKRCAINIRMLRRSPLCVRCAKWMDALNIDAGNAGVSSVWHKCQKWKSQIVFWCSGKEWASPRTSQRWWLWSKPSIKGSTNGLLSILLYPFLIRSTPSFESPTYAKAWTMDIWWEASCILLANVRICGLSAMRLSSGKLFSVYPKSWILLHASRSGCRRSCKKILHTHTHTLRAERRFSILVSASALIEIPNFNKIADILSPPAICPAIRLCMSKLFNFIQSLIIKFGFISWNSKLPCAQRSDGAQGKLMLHRAARATAKKACANCKRNEHSGWLLLF